MPLSALYPKSALLQILTMTSDRFQYFSQLAKVLEKVQLKLNKHDLKINSTQHAFLERRSTVSALASTTQDWYDSTDNCRDGGKGVHVVFVDFRKAFDLVDHGTLLTKLANMKVGKSFWLWIQSFLADRTQQVKLLGALSASRTVVAGVHQGEVISPMLFNVHMNDIEDTVPGVFQPSTCKYADDCTQYEIISNGTGSHMEEVMNNLVVWADKNMMELNVKIRWTN